MVLSFQSKVRTTMALPSNAKSIARKAQQEGVNPSVALTISHIETGGRFNHTAKNPTSSAHGLFQILDKTWKGQGGGDEHIITIAQMPSHQHPYQKTTTQNNSAGGTGPIPQVNSDQTGLTGGGQAHENRPLYYGLVYIMKVRY